MEQTHQQMTAPFSRLVRDEEANVRKRYDKDSIESMKASILSHGILQPIAVRPPQESDADLGGQLYRIFAGGRRYRAMSELVGEKKIDPDYQVPIIIRDANDTEASEMSLAENIIRRDMDPVDEFQAFKLLADQGKSVEDIALRFGQSERFVRGRLALGNLHPDILAALEREELSLAAACAYTLNPDQERQIDYFNGANQWQRDSVNFIKSAMRGEGAIRADSAMAKFIGEDAYLAAGGVIVDDLFGEDRSWVSPELIEMLRIETYETFKKKALEEGWSFVETTEEFGCLGLYGARYLSPEGNDLTEEESARMDEISDQLEGYHPMTEEEEDEHDKLEAEYQALEAKASFFTDEQKAKSGILFSFDHGRVDWRAGAFKDDGTKLSSSSSGDDAKPAKDPLALTQPLKDKIGDTATAALKVAVESKPDLALAMLAAMLEQGDSPASGVGRPSRIKLERYDYAMAPASKEVTIKTAFDRYAKMKPAELKKALATLIASTVDLSERWFNKDYTTEEKREKVRLEFINAFEADPVKHFDPEEYFSSCTKPAIDDAMKEMTGFSATKPKKADMAKEAAEAARETGWIPKPLRPKGYKIKKA